MKKIVVDCEPNDPVDIRCGGPHTLGFDFFVDDKDADELVKYIKKCLKTYDRPLMSIMVLDDESGTKIWDKKSIEECIKEGY